MRVTPHHPDDPALHPTRPERCRPRPPEPDAPATDVPPASAGPLPDEAPAPPNHPMTDGGQQPVENEGRQRLHRPSLLFLALATLLLGIAIPASAHAETTHALALVGSVTDLFSNIRNWLMGILFGLATVFFSVGGVRYLMAHGDPGEVEAAKRAFKSAGVGYGLAALAPLIATILQQIVGA
jgi:hypothetical protein